MAAHPSRLTLVTESTCHRIVSYRIPIVLNRSISVSILPGAEEG